MLDEIVQFQAASPDDRGEQGDAGDEEEDDADEVCCC